MDYRTEGLNHAAKAKSDMDKAGMNVELHTMRAQVHATLAVFYSNLHTLEMQEYWNNLK